MQKESFELTGGRLPQGKPRRAGAAVLNAIGTISWGGGMPSLLEAHRREYHKKIFKNIFGHRPKTTVFSNADKGSPASVALAQGLSDLIKLPFCKTPPNGQSAGALFTLYTSEFLESSFKLIEHLRPGPWTFSTSQARSGIACFHQYEHLSEFEKLVKTNAKLKAALGNDYLITPDITIARAPVDDKAINKTKNIISGHDVAKLTPLRSTNHVCDKDHPEPCQILHASVSCKWTMRSDRAQNTRTEALNLMRNRKGRTPAILAVTFEPLPSRIASIALGTGDIDCTYHGALYELLEAAKSSIYSDSVEMLELLIHGRRLRDISDLPFDLAT